MGDLVLQFTTGVATIDRLLRGLVRLIELSFPDRVRGFYLEGSYADGSAVATSDVDLRVVFKDTIDPAERQHFAATVDALKHVSSHALDIKLEAEEALLRVGAVRFQHGTQLIHGEDIRAQVPLKPIDDYIRDTVHFPYVLFTRMRGNPQLLSYPLDYPDPTGAFYGYASRSLVAPDGTSRASTKDLVLSVVCTATALVALDAGQYVVTKRDCLPQYRRWISDGWTSLVATVDEHCRNRWAYLVPVRDAERRQLRELCEQVLAFETHFLGRYQSFLLAELRHPDDAIRHLAIQRLKRIDYGDADVIEALDGLG